MNAKNQYLLWLLALALLAGCRSYGPRFDARQPGLEDPETTPAKMRPAGVLKLDDEAFMLVHRTNSIQAEWLSPPADFFRLGPGDVIEIEVFGEAAARSTALVGPDGKIYYSLLPGTFVWGLTLSEAKDALEKALEKYLRFKPEMTLNLAGAASKRVWILGSVRGPGVYSLATPLTLLEAISQAGGTLNNSGSTEEIADLEASFVMRAGLLLSVDFHRLLRLGDFSQNIYLQPDDFVYVQAAVARDVYVLGAVGRPNIVPYNREVTLLSALAHSGGPIPYAYLSSVAIIRGSLSLPRIATVNYKEISLGKAPDVRLEPGDIVYVSLRPFYKVEQLAEQVVNQFVRTVAVNEGGNAVVRGGPPTRVTVPLP